MPLPVMVKLSAPMASRPASGPGVDGANLIRTKLWSPGARITGTIGVSGRLNPAPATATPLKVTGKACVFWNRTTRVELSIVLTSPKSIFWPGESDVDVAPFTSVYEKTEVMALPVSVADTVTSSYEI